MKRNLSGFTIVEILVVISVISILATISYLSFDRYQADARDSERSAKTTVLAEAFEKYYDANGEYPSCAALTGTAVSVTTTVLPTLDFTTLIAPNSAPSETNSIECTDFSGTSSDPDYFAYIGDGSAACSTGQSCLEFTLKYKEESTGDIVTISSRRKATVATSGAITMTATTDGSTPTTRINLSWTSIPNTTSYNVQRATNASFTGATASSVTATTSAVTSLTPGTTYYFRVQPAGSTGVGDWSNTVTATTTVNPPTSAPTIATTIPSTGVARGTAAGGACASGTLEYQIRYHSTSVLADGSWSSWITGNPRDQSSAFQGNKYTFQSQARCVGPNANSAYVASTTSSTIIPFATLTPPVYTTSTASWGAGRNYMVNYSRSCPAGSVATAVAVRRHNAAFAPSYTSYNAPYVDWWYVGWNAGDYDSTYWYYAKYSCSTNWASAESAERFTSIFVSCEVARRSFSASPRCDNYGQGEAGNGAINY